MKLEQRFTAKIEPIPIAGCWIWLGAVDRRGYGRIAVNGANRTAHRVSYELFVGRIPEALCALHTCDVRCCVNPDHLYLGTHADNSRDCVARGRQYRPAGQRNPNVKLSEQAVLDIRADKRPACIVAADYGVSDNQVCWIRSRKTWGWLQ